jgi:hypothetical protein
MNSVDFKLSALPGQQPRLLLNCAMRRKHGSADVNHISLQGERLERYCLVLLVGDVEPETACLLLSSNFRCVHLRLCAQRCTKPKYCSLAWSLVYSTWGVAMTR